MLCYLVGKSSYVCMCWFRHQDSHDPMDCSLGKLLCPWDFPDKNAGVGCHFLRHLHLYIPTLIFIPLNSKVYVKNYPFVTFSRETNI